MFGFKNKLRKRHDKQKLDLSLLERMNRNNAEDQIEIGEIVDKAINGQFGTVLNLIINSLIDDELMDSRVYNKLSSDRALGRIESLNKLQDALDSCILRREELLSTNKEKVSVGTIKQEKLESSGPEIV